MIEWGFSEFQMSKGGIFTHFYWQINTIIINTFRHKNKSNRITMENNTDINIMLNINSPPMRKIDQKKQQSLATYFLYKQQIKLW